MSSHPNRRGRGAATAVAMLLAIATVGCGRSSAPPPANSAAPASTSGGGNTSTAGVFGSLGRICKPGSPTGGDSRGLTHSTIRLGTMSDAGAVVSPGLEQEFFDVGTAFVKWCNAAGGINGRKIALTKHDAKIFNGAQQVINACQGDFMLVGGGNAFDAPDVKPRLACKLAQIPAYVVSPEAATAPLQVTPAPSIPTEYQIGALRLLADAYPAAKEGLGIGSINVASLTPQGKREKQAWEGLGYKVTAVQEKPPAVTNFRPYMEQLKIAGAQAYDEIQATNAGPEVTAINDIGWKPAFTSFSSTFYDPKSVAAAKAIRFPPTYIGLTILPYELTSQHPVLQQVKDILNAAVSEPKFTNFTSLSMSAWTLWAKSASQCGDQLTPSCVLEKAASNSAWTGGGLTAPISLITGQQHLADCVLLMRLTPDGFAYDRGITQPNKGLFNCDPRNVAKVDSFASS